MQETENQLSQTSVTEIEEPEKTDNSLNSHLENQTIKEIEEGQSQDPSETKILGKFKSVDELSKAYTELQKLQGEKSKELGELRKNASAVENLTNSLQESINLRNTMKEYLDEYRNKYNTQEYFQNSSFKDIYKEAFMILGNNLDTDRFISLLENYVTSRISQYNKAQSAEKETQNVLEQMTYNSDSKTKFSPVQKSFDEMSAKEVDELLDRLI